MLDKELIRIINSGRCMLLVGSGISCDLGYPSWRQLAEYTVKRLEALGKIRDAASYTSLLDKKSYPELFRQAERDLGDDRAALVEIVKALLVPTSERPGRLYQLLTQWPFAGYLTTNFDSELIAHLSRFPEHFQPLRNRPEDFYHWEDGVTNIVQKLHSDLDHPEELILTSRDYHRLYATDAGSHYRDRLLHIFSTFNVLIVGHSLADPDIKSVLAVAKQFRGPRRPLYMIAADSTAAYEQDLFEQYNIVLIPYSNPDDTHSRLRRLLTTADRFIIPRDRRRESSPVPLPPEEAEAAAAMYIYRRLGGVQATHYLAPLVLSSLHGSSPVEMSTLASLPTLAAILHDRHRDSNALAATVRSLIDEQLVDECPDGTVAISEAGAERVRALRSVREAEFTKAFAQFSHDLTRFHPAASPAQHRALRKLAEDVIVRSFATRASAIANRVFLRQSASPNQLSDVFASVSGSAATIDEAALRDAFIQAMYHFIVEPDATQRKYLASVSQGYFLYHTLGLDPELRGVRQDVFAKTGWLLDSSILLPVLAVGCHNHQYGKELFRMLEAQGALCYTTPNLLKEAWQHFRWGVRFAKENGAGSLEFLRAALVKGRYRQNLFLDGYIGLGAEGRVATFDDYLRLVVPEEVVDFDAFCRSVTRHGIRVVDVSEVEGFKQEDWGDIEEARTKILSAREKRGSYRTPLQVATEAEVWVLLRKWRAGHYRVETAPVERVYFVSHSPLLDRVFELEAMMTWTPEALFKYLSSLPGETLDPDLLQQCMLQEYYYAGVSFVDKERYLRFFGPSIDAAKASYREERAYYVSHVEDTYLGELDDAFGETADLEKPFFVAQLGWMRAREAEKQIARVTERAAAAEQRAGSAEKRVKELESDQEKQVRKQRRLAQELATVRNRRDPKHVRKKRRQAKKRKRKKKRKG